MTEINIFLFLLTLEYKVRQGMQAEEITFLYVYRTIQL